MAERGQYDRAYCVGGCVFDFSSAHGVLRYPKMSLTRDLLGKRYTNYHNQDHCTGVGDLGEIFCVT